MSDPTRTAWKAIGKHLGLFRTGSLDDQSASAESPSQRRFWDNGATVYKFEPETLVRPSHTFEKMLAFEASPVAGKTLRIRFRGRLENPHGLNGFEEVRLSLFGFTACENELRPAIPDALFRSSFALGELERDVVLMIDLPEGVENLSLYAYTDRSVPFGWEISDLELLTEDSHIQVTVEGKLAHLDVQPLDLAKSWRQEGGRVFVRWLGREFYADMPNGYDLSRVTPEAFKVIEDLLFGQIETDLFGRKRLLIDQALRDRRFETAAPTFGGSKTLLCFSTGEDSTAAHALLPDDTISYFSRRPYRSYTTPSGAEIDLRSDVNEMRALERVPNTHVIDTTFEKIGLSVGYRHGYQDNFGYAAIGLLLASHFDVHVIAFGSVMEQVYMRSGNNFLDVVNYPASRFNRYRDLFASASIFFTLPTGYLSEVLTNKICELSRDKYTAVPCPDTDFKGNACGICFKCFRKSRMNGAVGSVPSPAVEKTLTKRPLKSATSMMYAMQKSGFHHPALVEFEGVDLSFLDRYFGDGFEGMLPESLKSGVKERLDEFGIEAMTHDDEIRLREIAKTFDPQNFAEHRAFPLGRKQIPHQSAPSEEENRTKTKRLKPSAS